MLEDGTYAAWFKTPLREGAGIVHFANGKIWGGDSIISYSGSYEVDGDRWTATVLTRRHSAGHDTASAARARSGSRMFPLLGSNANREPSSDQPIG
jgi:hypothetical protein